MDLLDIQYQAERRADELRAAEQEARIQAALEQIAPKPKPRRVRRAVGEKLVELGKRLQDAAELPEPSAPPRRQTT